MNLNTQSRAKFAMETLLAEALHDLKMFNPLTQVVETTECEFDTDTQIVTMKYEIRERPDDYYQPDPRD